MSHESSVSPFSRIMPSLVGLLAIIPPLHADPPPNILLIVSEDNGPELGCYGDSCAQTPRLDQLAAEGLLFENAYVPQAGCSQSRASFLTGLYPHQHGQIGLATWGFRLYREDTPNLPGQLKAAGYRTGLIGKLHINPAESFPFDLHEIRGANFQRTDLAQYARQAKAFINADAAPFFLSVNYPDAHDPWLRQVNGLPENPLSAEDVRVMDYMGVDSSGLRELVADYYNCLARLDRLVGDLLDELDASGKRDNTIVIYLGDHGADMLRGKRTCYEGGLRIPLLIRGPGITPQVRRELVSTLDLMPTLLAAAGAAPVDGLAGDRLQPLFRAEPADWRSHFCAEYHTHAAAPNYFPQRSIRSQRYKLIESLLPDTVHPDYEKTMEKLEGDFARRNRGPLDLPAVIAASRPIVRSAYQTMQRPPRYQLYDLAQDPHEFRNLADDPAHKHVFRDLQRRLQNWRMQTSDPLLDENKLQQLTREVQSVRKRTVARKHDWQYPRYLKRDRASEPAADVHGRSETPASRRAPD